MNKYLYTIFFGVLFISCSAFANNNYYPTGRKMMTNCLQYIRWVEKKSYDTKKAYWCMGFVQGMESWHLFYSSHSNHEIYCLPNNVSLDHVVRVILRYIMIQKVNLTKPAVLLSIDALHLQYPCN